jgi:hypothetical protein
LAEKHVWEGRRGLQRNREAYQNKILQELMLAPQGLVRRKELFEAVDWHGNKRFFEECLSALVESKKIEKIKSGRKHVEYGLIEDDAAIQSFMMSFQKNKKEGDLLWKACGRSSELEYDACVRLYEYAFLSQMKGYLALTLKVAAVSERWRNFLVSLIELDSFWFGLLMELCKQNNREAFDESTNRLMTEFDGVKTRKGRLLLKEV